MQRNEGQESRAQGILCLIGNVYLEASKTCKKVFIVTGPEFRDLARHLILIEQASCGLLWFSGQMFEEFLAERLQACSGPRRDT